MKYIKNLEVLFIVNIFYFLDEWFKDLKKKKGSKVHLMADYFFEKCFQKNLVQNNVIFL